MENINQMPNLQPIEPISPVKNQNLFKYLFIASIIILLGVIISFYLVLNKKNSQINLKDQIKTEVTTSEVVENEIIPTEIIDINKIFNEIYSQVEKVSGVTKIVKEDNVPIWWITEDNKSITVPSNLFFTTEIVGKELITIKKELGKVVSNILLQNGFTLDKNNSSFNETDYKFYDYIQAYKFNNFKCVINSSGDEDSERSSFSFSCLTDEQIKLNYDKQLPFLKVLNLETTSAIFNLKIQGDEALMEVRGRRGGGLAYMYKLNNQWILISEGNGGITCEELEEKKIPVNHWPSCYNQDGTIKIGTFSVK